jgi:hypothetical protein
MGHTEMLLAVAGLDDKALAERTRRLASGNWSSFPPAEQAAFAFARKQAQTPWDVSRSDVDTLVRHFGTDGAFDMIWLASRCNYMTKVADAFQLPLEKENVFQRTPPAANPKEKPSPPANDKDKP